MAIANKIVDTRRLAAKGRYGRDGTKDTKIRNVRGRPSHVSAYEAYLVDNYGERGGDAVEAIGSGTINPETGLKEYTHILNLPHGGWEGLKSAWDVTLGKEGIGGKIGEHWEWLTPSGGTEWFGTGPSENVKLEKQSKGIIAGGMENLKTQYGQYMGDGDPGFLEREEDIRIKKLQDVYDVTMGGYDIAGKRLDTAGEKLVIAGEKLSESTGMARRDLSENIRTGYGQLKTAGEKQVGQADFAYSGTIAENIRKGKQKIGKQYTSGMEDIGKQYTLGMEDIDIGRKDIGLQREDIILGETGAQNIYDVGMESSALIGEKGEADFMAGLRKQMNQMLIDYQGATGEAYGGGDILNQLNTLFDQYSENA